MYLRNRLRGRTLPSGNERSTVRSGHRKADASVIWFDYAKGHPGHPPLRVTPSPKGSRGAFSETVRTAVVDYAVEQRKTMSVKECAEICGICEATLSRWIREECRTYRGMDAALNTYNGRAINYRELLADLRVGKRPIFLPDYVHSG